MADTPFVDAETIAAADAILPDEIRPAGGRSQARTSLQDARSVLLTGATGFLGRWIANALLLESNAAIVCLVRGRAAESYQRVDAALAATGIDPAGFPGRISVVHGDLRQHRLGLTESQFEALACDIDAICHAGAAVNWVQPYDGLKASNVTGTLELLRLAARRCAPFHFVSSLSVCYSTSAPLHVDERYDPLPDVGGLHLGYAQTKVVAEALVREAARRGLPVAIYRPSLISGHSRSGAFNRDDILARVLSGCVRMRAAPDLDWSLDCVPVDVAAGRIATTATAAHAVHLSHHRPRDWRECVLWLRLYGYDVHLVPYREWLARLDRDTRDAAGRDHPLRPLRPFFLRRIRGDRGRTLPELMTGADREFGVTDAVGPPLDAALLQRYCDAFVACGDLPRPPSTSERTAAPSPDAAFIRRVMNRPIAEVEPLSRLSEHSIIGELTSWRSGHATGVFRYRFRDGGAVRDAVVKVKPRDRDVIAVGSALAHLCDVWLGRAYDRWSDRLGVCGANRREPAIYRQRDSRFSTHAPAALAILEDEASGVSTLVLEALTDTLLRDSVDRPHVWQPAHVDCAVRGLAKLQAIWFNRSAELAQQPWIGYIATAEDMAEMTDFWRANATHARPAFAVWTDDNIGAIQGQLIDRIAEWWSALEDGPRTLIHNDFNLRNVCLRAGPAGPRLAAYDWELATIGAPQHDLAEFLCFVLPERPTRHEVDTWIERHRMLLEDETGTRIDRATWIDGFRASLYDLMLNRLPMYRLIDRVRRQTFLPRVVRVWSALYRLFPLAD